MEDLSTKDKVIGVITAVVIAVVFVLGWALPEDHTTDHLYQPVAETRA